MTTEASRVAARFARTAAIALDEGVLRQIAKLTDQNYHAKALVLGAKALKETKLAKKAELVEQLQELEGHLPKELKDYRWALYEELMGLAKQALSPEDYEKFHGSF